MTASSSTDLLCETPSDKHGFEVPLRYARLGPVGPQRVTANSTSNLKYLIDSKP
jgi:hypothetical protein